MRVALAALPLEWRAELARDMILHGEDPLAMLAAAVWPSDTAAVFIDVPTFNEDGLCVRGHVWNEENTFIRPNGHRRCRQCETDLKNGSASEPKYKAGHHKKVPCVLCGEPATAPKEKRSKTEFARCRRCYRREWVRAKRKVA